jgi:predicted TIM-barrel fold metal-dependent hydrolase
MAGPASATTDAPPCPPPPATQPQPRLMRVPPGAVDTHCHVIGTPPDYPFVAGRSYTPPGASPAAYINLLDTMGMTYGVLTQVSVHGTDNRLMVETLTANRARLRGIAVLGLDATDAERATLLAAGVVGLRLNVLYGGGIGFDRVEAYGALCKEMGWHLQFLIDHMGHFPTSRGVDSEGFQTLLALVRDGAWARLSGAYRTTVQGPPYDDTVPFAQALVKAAPERCVWGSDWPHVANWGVMMTVADLLDLLARWVPDEELRRRILVDNPHRLFGFGT